MFFLQNVLKIELIFLVLMFSSCKQVQKDSKLGANTTVLDEENYIQILMPRHGEMYKENTDIPIEIRSLSNFDSVWVKFEGNKIGKFISGENTRVQWRIRSEKLGKNSMEFITFSGEKQKKQTIKFTLLSSTEPTRWTYKILKVYPHSNHAYTQGLLYDEGYLYESDGQYGMSVLRKVEIHTGKTLQQHILADKYFAEGIALFKNKIYQITWKENTCFVYDKNDFTLLKELKYDIAEGWGLATDGEFFYMTDGSNVVYIIDPETFNIIDSFEVVDNKGKVDNLNEIEYVDGLLFANVYQTDGVVVIDVKKRRLVAHIDFTGLLKPEDINSNTDVLNGIAYNPLTKNFYITGKNWPKLFEIKINVSR